MASLTQWTRLEQARKDGEGQGSLAFCSTWGRKESDTTEQLNNSVFLLVKNQNFLILKLVYVM